MKENTHVRSLLNVGQSSHLGPWYWMLFLVAFCFASAVDTSVARAQSGEQDQYEYNLYGGYMLPNRIHGVTEIQPLFGGRFSLRQNFGDLEFGLQNSHAYGVDFFTLSGVIRGELPFSEGMILLLSIGPDFHYFRPYGETKYRAQGGLQVGAGGLVHITGHMHLRGDLTFKTSPGTALEITAGLQYR